MGILLLLLPSGRSKPEVKAAACPSEDENTEETLISRSLSDTENELAALLSRVEGAGSVQVMLSLDTQDESVLAADVDGDESRTVLISVGSGQEEAVVRGVNCARYRGAVVLAQGADSAQVRLALTQAVSVITGLGADNISVLKMK